jgi:hypothetical protein
MPVPFESQDAFLEYMIPVARRIAARRARFASDVLLEQDELLGDALEALCGVWQHEEARRTMEDLSRLGTTAIVRKLTKTYHRVRARGRGEARLIPLEDWGLVSTEVSPLERLLAIERWETFVAMLDPVERQLFEAVVNPSESLQRTFVRLWTSPERSRSKYNFRTTVIRALAEALQWSLAYTQAVWWQVATRARRADPSGEIASRAGGSTMAQSDLDLSDIPAGPVTPAATPPPKAKPVRRAKPKAKTPARTPVKAKATSPRKSKKPARRRR